MNIHEYQAKELLAKYGVAVPKGIAAMTVEEAVAAAKQLPGPLYVVKSHWNNQPIVLIERTSNGWIATLAADSTRSLLATTSTKAPTAKKKPTRKKAAKKKPKPR